MSLDDMNGVMADILCYFTELADFVANYVTIVEGRSYCPPKM